MTTEETIERLVRNADQQPSVDKSGIPFCTEDECCQYDGKRCRVSGFRPGYICEPAVLVLIDVVVSKRGGR